MIQKIEIDPIQIIIDAINSPDFNPSQWSIYNAELLIQAGTAILKAIAVEASCRKKNK